VEFKIIEESDRVKGSFETRVYLEGKLFAYYPLYSFEIRRYPDGRIGAIERQVS
jgi:hypothetical protein